MIKKIIFYSGIPRNFKSTSIGYLYEISQVYPVVFLSEELPSDLRKLVENKKLFPKLEKIIAVNQYTGPKRNVFSKNRYLRNLARRVINEEKPDIVIAPFDIYPFEMYLMRFAKKINSITIAAQEGNAVDANSRMKHVDLMNACLRFPIIFPLFVRSFLVQSRKRLGHILYYWILPILAGEEPFWGKSSFVLRKGISGMRDADYQIVFSERDYDIFLRAGVERKKLHVLAHPLKRGIKSFFEKFLIKEKSQEAGDKAATVLICADEIGFKRADYSFISEETKLEKNREILKLISKILKGWKIYVKPHPDVRNFKMIKELEAISDFVKVADPSEPIDEYIKKSKVVIELPISISTVLFSTSLISPQKPIISLDFDKEVMGDFYKDFEGIEYIDNKEKFVKILELIRDGKFKNKIKTPKKSKEDFLSFIDLLNFLILKKSK